MSEALTEARVREIMDGCEGVTPGPWRYHEPDPGYCIDYVLSDAPEVAPSPEYRFRNLIAETDIQGSPPPGDPQRFTQNAKHIARLDPDTVRALCILALSALGTAPAVGVRGLEESGLAAAQAVLTEKARGTGFSPIFATDVIRAYVNASPAPANAAEIRAEVGPWDSAWINDWIGRHDVVLPNPAYAELKRALSEATANGK